MPVLAIYNVNVKMLQRIKKDLRD